jgi:hypothetical protein
VFDGVIKVLYLPHLHNRMDPLKLFQLVILHYRLSAYGELLLEHWTVVGHGRGPQQATAASNS